jgi:hypothetical protein
VGAEANGGKEVSPTLLMEMDRHFFFFFFFDERKWTDTTTTILLLYYRELDQDPLDFLPHKVLLILIFHLK